MIVDSCEEEARKNQFAAFVEISAIMQEYHNRCKLELNAPFKRTYSSKAKHPTGQIRVRIDKGKFLMTTLEYRINGGGYVGIIGVGKCSEIIGGGGWKL